MGGLLVFFFGLQLQASLHSLVLKETELKKEDVILVGGDRRSADGAPGEDCDTAVRPIPRSFPSSSSCETDVFQSTSAVAFFCFFQSCDVGATAEAA